MTLGPIVTNIYNISGKLGSSPTKWISLHSINLLVGRSTPSLCASSFGNCPRGLPVDPATMRDGTTRIYHCFFEWSQGSAKRQNLEASSEILCFAAIRHLGNECPSGQCPINQTANLNYCFNGCLELKRFPYLCFIFCYMFS